MISQDYKKRHQMHVIGLWQGREPGVVMDCSCGREWIQDHAPFATSLVKCACGAHGWFDLRSDSQRTIDAGGAP